MFVTLRAFQLQVGFSATANDVAGLEQGTGAREQEAGVQGRQVETMPAFQCTDTLHLLMYKGLSEAGQSVSTYLVDAAFLAPASQFESCQPCCCSSPAAALLVMSKGYTGQRRTVLRWDCQLLLQVGPAGD